MDKPTERLLQFIWQYQHFPPTGLRSCRGEPLEIIQPGQFNTNQGPDFSNARIKIAGTTWAGQVELHLHTSDWDKHRHGQDKHYSNVILHVVWRNDREVNDIPVLELCDRVPKILLDRYAALLQSKNFIACEHIFSSVPGQITANWIDNLAAGRLLRKALQQEEKLRLNEYHWEELFWWLLARNFGIQLNADCFEVIARSLPLNILAKHKGLVHQLEALLLGQAGLLDDEFTENYPLMLQKDYRYYCKLYKLHPVNQQPVFMRMRPSNFPSVRLAQLAMLIHDSAHLFSRIKTEESVEAVRDWFCVTPSDYWHYHYRFGEKSGFNKKTLGRSMINAIIINSICPVLFAYGNYYHEHKYRDKAIAWLQSIPAEENSIIDGFKILGLTARSAFESQALLELKKQYCDQKRCLDCMIGCHILR